MARRSRGVTDLDAGVASIKSILDSFLVARVEGDLRAQVKHLVPAFFELRDLGTSLMAREGATSARERIITYFRLYPLTLIDGSELMVVSGIGEWARRLRELRVEYGWSIWSGVTFKEMAEGDPDLAGQFQTQLGCAPADIPPDQYVLTSVSQDREAAFRWNVLNTIRKKSGGVKSKLLEYLRANVGKPVTGEELRYLAGDIKEWARRVRELRTQDGWPVYTSVQGHADLPIGWYILEEDKQAAVHDRNIPDDVRVSVLTRDGFACSFCGWRREDIRPDDPRKLLELHHIEHHVAGGLNVEENLITLCNVDHDALHAGRLKIDIDGKAVRVKK